MDIITFFDMFSNHNLFIKLLLIIFTPLYGAFSLILAIQIASFEKLVEQETSSFSLSSLAKLNVLLAIALFVLSVLLL